LQASEIKMDSGVRRNDGWCFLAVGFIGDESNPASERIAKSATPH
jgi:hypothetical protein